MKPHWIVAALLFIVSTPALAGSCRLEARHTLDLAVWIERGGNKAEQSLAPSTLYQGGSVQISTDTDRIVFDYRYGASDSWKSVHAWCQRGDTVRVP